MITNVCGYICLKTMESCVMKYICRTIQVRHALEVICAKEPKFFIVLGVTKESDMT